MEVIKAFNNNEIGTQIVIKGSPIEPLFRLNDIGTVLSISNIHTTIKDFDESQKVLHTMETLGGKQQVAFLTEFGLYEVLFRSRKPIAKKFKKWVCEVIKDIRLKGKYELEKKTEELENKLEKVENRLEINQEELKTSREVISEYNDIENVFDIKKFKGKNVFYLISYDEDCYKMGITVNLEKRFRDHKSTFEKNFSGGEGVIKCWEIYNTDIVGRAIEYSVKTYAIYKGIKTKFKGTGCEFFKTENIGLMIKIIDHYVKQRTGQYKDMFKNAELEQLNTLISQLIKTGNEHLICGVVKKYGTTEDNKLYEKDISTFSTQETIEPNIELTKEDVENEIKNTKDEAEKKKNVPENENEVVDCKTCSKKYTNKEMGIRPKSKNIYYKNCPECRKTLPICKPRTEKGGSREGKCTYGKCPNTLDKTIINPTTKTYYKRCVSCREILKEKDRKRYEEQKSKRLQAKKDQYEKYKTDIRKKQKEYYDGNKTEIIERKKQLKYEKYDKNRLKNEENYT